MPFHTHARATLLAIALGLAVVVVPSAAGAQVLVAPAPAVATQPSPTIVPGQVIVKLRPGTSEAARTQVLAAAGARLIRELDLSDLILAQVPVGSEVDAAESLQVDPNVEFAEPNGRLQANAQ
jgi:hypothetical protein